MRRERSSPRPALHLDQVGVISDERACRTEVNHPTCRRRCLAERVHVRHDVVTKALLVFGDLGEIHVVVEVLLHLGDRRGERIHAEVVFGLREGEPGRRRGGPCRVCGDQSASIAAEA